MLLDERGQITKASLHRHGHLHGGFLKTLGAAVVEKPEYAGAQVRVVDELLRDADADVVESDNDRRALAAPHGDQAREADLQAEIDDDIRYRHGNEPDRQDLQGIVVDITRGNTDGDHDADEHQPVRSQLSQRTAGGIVESCFAWKTYCERQYSQDDILRAEQIVVADGDQQQGRHGYERVEEGRDRATQREAAAPEQVSLD